MTKLGSPIDPQVREMRRQITSGCKRHLYKVVDASSDITGKDFLLKIWRQLASVPLAIGIAHESIPPKTQANIYYELGVAQGLGKETLVVKSKGAEVPSDFVRTEWVEFDGRFPRMFDKYMRSLKGQAAHYELVAGQLDRNPVLAIDYLRRAFLITGQPRLRAEAKALLSGASLGARAKNSVELLAASF